MTKGYDERYLDDAMRNLGESFDYAVNVCHYDLDKYLELFISSGLADQFAKGNPKYVSGYSGTELFFEVMDKVNINVEIIRPQTIFDCSSEYWSGWVLAYYQWKTGKSFRDIHRQISMNSILKMYPTLHEASEDKFVDILDAKIDRKKETSKLQQQRRICGYSQRELAEKSGVNLRTLQQYELKTKDISKASVDTVISLTNVLGCSIDMILERD